MVEPLNTPVLQIYQGVTKTGQGFGVIFGAVAIAAGLERSRRLMPFLSSPPPERRN
jgi:hypothetical protein